MTFPGQEWIREHLQTGANKDPKWKRSQAAQCGDEVASEKAEAWLLIFQGLMYLRGIFVNVVAKEKDLGELRMEEYLITPCI